MVPELFIIAIAGYIFTHTFYYTRFRSQELGGYRLVFEAFAWGTLFIYLTWLAPLSYVFQQTVTEASGQKTQALFLTCLQTWFYAAASGGIGNIMVGFVAGCQKGKYNDFREILRDARTLLHASFKEMRELSRNITIRNSGRTLLMEMRKRSLVDEQTKKREPVWIFLRNQQALCGLIRSTPDLKFERDEAVKIDVASTGYVKCNGTLQVTWKKEEGEPSRLHVVRYDEVTRIAYEEKAAD